MESTGGILEAAPELLGTYLLQSFFQNGRVVYGNMEAEAYLFSLIHDNEEVDGAWMVWRNLLIYVMDFIVMDIKTHNVFVLIKIYLKYV